MISCFKKSTQVRWIITFAGALIAVVLFMMPWDTPIFVRGLYAIVAFAMGAVAANLIALKMAVKANGDLLNLLNIQGNAEKFVEEYKVVPERAKKDSSEFIVTSNYLCSGYMALGEFDKALKILSSLEGKSTKYHQLSIKAFILNNTTQIYLWQENKEKALEKLEVMKALRDESQERNKAVHQNLSFNIKLYEQHLKILNQEMADLDYIKEEISLSNSIVHKNNMKLLLAMGYLNAGKKEEAKEMLSEVTASGLNVFSVKKAEELLKNL